MLVGLHLRRASAARESLQRTGGTVRSWTPRGRRPSPSDALYFEAHECGRLAVLDDAAQRLDGRDSHGHVAIAQHSGEDVDDRCRGAADAPESRQL